ncbi:hypothetical protein [Fructobacillus fructosus]|uniref:hypothetical protein n=1 Tax=Fructobacillus fructosus TaxID=1631 RepID=UPI002D901290|nr:hypothetical protein LMG30235_GOPAMIKF_00694 [Fructobacillus fructosus]CAK1236801.1 hypothetical protein R54866_LGPIEIPA_00695 [Fructobacillus fructosus]CAK1238084.1 hypothetical protein LMG30234_GAICNKDF_00755 [Fructobacillus fructosus]
MRIVKKTLVIATFTALTILAAVGISFSHTHTGNSRSNQKQMVTAVSSSISKVEPTSDSIKTDDTQESQEATGSSVKADATVQNEGASSTVSNARPTSQVNTTASTTKKPAEAQTTTAAMTAPATAGTATESTTISVKEAVRTDGFNFLGQHFDISSFSNTTGGNTPRWTPYIFQWTALPNYYLAEAASSAGSAVRQLSIGSEVVVNGQTYHVTVIRHGMKRLDSMDVVESLSGQHQMGLQTCDDASGSYISTYWFD